MRQSELQQNRKLESLAEMTKPYFNKSRTCSRCQEEKGLAAFNKNRAMPDGYQRYCKSCQSEATRKWQKDNRHKANATARRYNKGRGREYYLENKGKIETYRREWYKQNPTKRAEYKRAYRARKANNSTEHFTNEEFDALCESFGNKCLCCGNEKPLEADHIIAIINGGPDDITNIQPLCRECNASKNRKTIDYR